VISGNGNDGVVIDNTTGTTILGNLIGTDKTGLVGMPNGTPGVTESIGILTQYDSTGTVIGGIDRRARNVLSAQSNGIRVATSAGSTTLIEGNFIGTDATGKAALGNDQGGVLIFTGTVTVGGLTATPGAGAGNVISGNNDGVIVYAPGTTIQGNLIGTDALGTHALGNTNEGVGLGSSGNLLGGTAPERGTSSRAIRAAI